MWNPKTSLFPRNPIVYGLTPTHSEVHEGGKICSIRQPRAGPPWSSHKEFLVSASRCQYETFCIESIGAKSGKTPSSRHGTVCGSQGLLEYGADIAIAYGIFGKTKGAVLPHFASPTKKRTQRCPRESAADADALDSEYRELSETELDALQTHDHIYRAID